MNEEDIVNGVKNLVSSGITSVTDLFDKFSNDPVEFSIEHPFIIKEIVSALKNRAPFLYRDRLFWERIDKFFDGAILSEEDKIKFINKLSDSKKSKDNMKRVINGIEKLETDKKVNYLIKISRDLIDDKIDLSTYFHIYNVIIRTLDEDLKFLAENITKKEISYNMNVEGLFSVGLVGRYNTFGNGILEDSSFYFTPLARLVSKYIDVE